MLYNPKAFIAHAASLGQACAHCQRSSTAATRRCLASVSVPVARVVLSHPLRILALVGRYPANKLIRREPLPGRNPFGDKRMSPRHIAGNYPDVSPAMPIPRVGYPRITAPFATQSASNIATRGVFVRLACLIHAANVRSEPGSNPSQNMLDLSGLSPGSCRVGSRSSDRQANAKRKRHRFENKLKESDFFWS